MKPSALWQSWRHSPKPRKGSAQQSLLGAFLEAKGPSKSLPLWEPLYPTEANTMPQERDKSCTSCDLHSKVTTVAMKGTERITDIGMRENKAVLVVMGSPTKDEDQCGKPYTSVIGRYVQRTIERLYPGNVHYTYAVSCSAGRSAEAKHFDACRPHVWDDIAKVKPERVILLGFGPLKAMTGRYLDTQHIRRSWAYVNGLPMFPLMDPEMSARNQFHKRHFESDLRWALLGPLPQAPKGTVHFLETGAEVSTFLRGLSKTDATVIDVENVGDVWKADFRLLCVGLCQDPENPVVATPEALHEVGDEFRAWLADPSYPKVNQTINYDRAVLFREFGVDIRGIDGDTHIWSRLYDAESPSGLAHQAWLVGFGGYKQEADSAAAEAVDEERGGNKFAAMEGTDLMTRYNGRDTSVTKRLEVLRRRKLGPKLLGTWQRLVGPAFDALGVVERTGMLLSPDNVRAYDTWLLNRESVLLHALTTTPGVPTGFNHKSPPQKAHLLYDILKLPAPSDRNTQRATLEELTSKHPVVATLIELGAVGKQRSTYGLNMLENVSPLDGRVHTSFDIVRTGRLSSRRPNLQNITASHQDGDEGSWARGCFVAPPGHKLVALDYAQMELRVAAMLSGDEEMAAAFEAGVDFHTMTAAAAFNVKPETVTSNQRKAAKALNFALIFGKSEYGIAMDLGIKPDEAKALMESLLGKYAKLRDWRQRQIAQGETEGEVWCVWDPPGKGLNWIHRRGVEDIAHRPADRTRAAEGIRKHQRNITQNTPIQNVANAFSLASVTDLVNWTLDEAPDVKVIVVVHDEIVLEVPEAKVVEVGREARRIMTSWPSGCVKLKADAEVGDDWGHMEKLDL